MVNFVILNELSLPMGESKSEAKENIKVFLKTLNKLKDKKISSVRSIEDLRTLKVTPTLTMVEYLGTIRDRDFKTRMISLISGKLSKIETPLYNLEEEEKYQLRSLEHSCEGIEAHGLGACDIFETLSISFIGSSEFEKSKLYIKKEFIGELGDIEVLENIEIKNIFDINSLGEHDDFLIEILKFNYDINQRNFAEMKSQIFNKIKFCEGVDDQIESLGADVFEAFINKLILIELEVKNIVDFKWSKESKSVERSEKFKSNRMFKHCDLGIEKIYFQNHLKGFPNGNRVYFLEKDNNIYIGYIGKHLPTKTY